MKHAAILVFGLVVISTLSHAEGAKPIRLGAIFCLTGEIAMGCNAIREGVEVAVEEVNQLGGVQGRPLEVEFQDTQFNPRIAHSVGKKFSAEQSILGVLITGIVETKAAAAVLERAKLPSITLWDSTPELEELGEYPFAIGPWLPSTYEVSAQFAYNKLGARSATIIGTNSEWSEAVAKGFADTFTAAGGSVLDLITTVPDESDFRSVILRAIKKKPAVIYAPIVAKLPLFFKQLRQAGFKGQVITSDNLNDEIISTDPSAFEGVYQSQVADPETERAKHLQILYAKKFSKPSSMLVYNAWGYDGLWLFAKALNSGEISREALRRSLEKLAPHNGALGEISFNQGGSWRMPASIFKIISGKLVRVNNS